MQTEMLKGKYSKQAFHVLTVYSHTIGVSFFDLTILGASPVLRILIVKIIWPVWLFDLIF